MYNFFKKQNEAILLAENHAEGSKNACLPTPLCSATLRRNQRQIQLSSQAPLESHLMTTLWFFAFVYSRN